MASTSDLSLVSLEARRTEEGVHVVDEGDVVFVSENAASKTARRSRAIVSGKGKEREKRTGNPCCYGTNDEDDDDECHLFFNRAPRIAATCPDKICRRPPFPLLCGKPQKPNLSARRFHDRNMAAIQRQAERGRKKRQEFEAKREKIKKDLNQQVSGEGDRGLRRDLGTCL